MLRALRANTTALHRLSAQRPFDARRTRALRAQSRDLAAAAASLDGGGGGEEVQSALRDFGVALRESVAAEQESVAEVAVAVEEGEEARRRLNDGERGDGAPADAVHVVGEQTSLLAGKNAVAVAEEAEFRANEQLRREREAALRDVHASVADVNAIFVDLAGMVGEQSSQVEYVELQLGDAADNVRKAKKELESGNRRREKRKRLFFMALFCIAMIFSIFLVLVLS